MSVIEIEGLTKRFGEVTALQSIDLTVEAGEVFGFLGPNGAGKSTTIDILLDFRRPTSGSVSVLGADPQEAPAFVRRRCGVLPDRYELFDRLSARRHCAFAAELSGQSVDSDQVLSRVGLADVASRPVGGFSKGMRQRLALAMALVGDPDLLILDEPMSGLDPNGIQTLRSIIDEEADRGTTVLFSSHLLAEVEVVCDRVGILDGGNLLAVDEVEGLREILGATSVLELDLDPAPNGDLVDELESLPEVDGVTSEGHRLRVQCASPGVKSDVIVWIDGNGHDVCDLDVTDRELEALFTDVTEEGAA